MGKAISVMKVFVKENGISLVVLHLLLFEENTQRIIGVCIEKWF